MEDNLVPGFVVGFVTGVIITWVVGFVVRKILWCWGRVTAIRRPQGIKSSTDKTPWQVLIDGCKSLLLLIILVICVLVGMLLFGSASLFGWEEVVTFVRRVAQP